MCLDATLGSYSSARAAGPAAPGRLRDLAGFAAAPEDFSSPRLSEVSARGRPPCLGADGQLSRRTHTAVQHPSRTEAAGGEVAGELPAAASQTGSHLRGESRIVAGQAVVIVFDLVLFHLYR